MIFYTIVPIEELLAGIDEERNFLEVRRGSVQMQVEPVDGVRGRVIRLLSTAPTDYLDPQYQPGAFVDLTSADYGESDMNEVLTT